MLPISGIPGMRISFSSYISVLPSFLFGPLYGGAAMGIKDVLSYFLVRPEGGFMLPLTITAITKGVLLGVFYNWVKNKHTGLLRFNYLKVFICLMPVNILITTINTNLLMMLYSINKAFWLFYAPRLAEEIINIFVQSYIVGYLLKLSERLYKKE